MYRETQAKNRITLQKKPSDSKSIEQSGHQTAILHN
uniref:Uncharacterized protein n=1 Tax=Arundo donax TaxID=35708 RepID=A0A0A9A8K5_ARUDO